MGKRTKFSMKVAGVGLVCAQLLMWNVGCEGPAGAAGADGADGADGVDGADGADGAGMVWKGALAAAPTGAQLNWAYYNTADSVAYIHDGTAWDTMFVGFMGPQGPAGVDMNKCGACHNDGKELYAKMDQYRTSVHFNGGNFERNGTSCASCHTHEGFVEVAPDAKFGEAVAAAPMDPTPINCRTCHPIHTKYDTTDYALRVTAGGTFALTKTAYDFGKANICVSCHQPRAATPVPVPTSADSVNVSSTRYGPHHGPQGSLLAGVGGAEIAGTEKYTATVSHGKNIADGCVTCHMASAFGRQAGGHTFGVAYEYHAESVFNTAGCISTSCHSTTADSVIMLIEDLHTEIEALLDTLAIEMAAEGVVNRDTTTGAVSIKTGKKTAVQASALWNYKTIEEDRSNGVHNPSYIRALLKNSIAELRK